MIRSLFLFLLAFTCFSALAQQQVVIADAITSEALPFATVKQGSSAQGIITDINGRFAIPKDVKALQVSYIGHLPKTVSYPYPDTVFLSLQSGTMQEVVVKPPYEKIKYIINNAVRNKTAHNPDKYDRYSCAVYYKMIIDLLPRASMIDSAKRARLKAFTDQSHLLFAETYSKRYYRKPDQVQEIIEASRFSGFQKTYFTNLITNVLPFHAYNDYIKLNEKDYNNPIAAGWQQRYDFDLLDEVIDGMDTIYILKYRPKKNATFNSLRGTVYIHSNGFAISHLIAATADAADTTITRYAKIEQIYRPVEGKWFPQELNFELVFREYPSKKTGMSWKGHCMVDSVSFAAADVKFDKARSVVLSDSVDLRSDAEWNRFRFDSLVQKERNTYALIDSLSQEAGAEKVVNAFRNISNSRLSIGYIDVELKRLLSYNTYEGYRLGIGLFTNDKISKYISLGGWFGYGIKDKEWKYGGSARMMPGGQKDNWVELGYQNNYKNTGSINFHKELDRNGLRQWALARVDRIKEYSATLHGRLGYYELELSGIKQELEPQYAYTFTEAGTNGHIFNLNEASVCLRYAHGEVRTPAFGYYLPAVTKYPILYIKASGGEVTSGSYDAQYIKTLAAITHNVHINRWGRDNYRVEGGIIHTLNDVALPPSFLLAGNGFRMSNTLQWYTPTGFLTMTPFEYFSDQYASLLYRHDFDRAFFHIETFCRPTLSIAHNMMYGSLTTRNQAANPGIKAPVNGYHETGIILNKLLTYDLMKLANINFNAGAYYHWGPAGFDWNMNGRFTLGLTADL